MEPRDRGWRCWVLWALIITVYATSISMPKRTRGWCLLCGTHVKSVNFTAVVHAKYTRRPDHCSGSGSCCAFHVASQPRIPIHLHAQFSKSDPSLPLDEAFAVARQKASEGKRGASVCSECARSNRTLHNQLRDQHLSRQEPTPAKFQTLGAVLNVLLASNAVAVTNGTTAGGSINEPSVVSRARAAAQGSSAVGVSLPSTLHSPVNDAGAPAFAAPAVDQPPPILAPPPGPASPPPPSPPPPSPHLLDPITLPPSTSLNPLEQALPPLPSSTPPPLPPNPVCAPPADQQPPPQPPQSRPPRHANFTTTFGFRAAPPTAVEVMFYTMLDVFYNNHCYHADDTRMPSASNQTVILGRMAPLFSHLSGVPCPESQLRHFLAAFRKGQVLDLPAAYTTDKRKRCNVYARQIYDFASSDAGRLIAELLEEENPLEAYISLCDAAFPLSSIRDAAAASAATAGEYDILPEGCRLANISDSFQPGQRAGCSQWDEAVLDNWACYEHINSEGKRVLRFVPRNSSVHDGNRLELQLHSDLTYSIFSCGERAFMPSDGPNLDRLLNQQALMKVLKFVHACHPCAGGTAAAVYGPYLQYQQQKAGAKTVVALERYRDTPRRVHLPGHRAGGGASTAQILDVHPSHSCYGLVSNHTFAARCPRCAAGAKMLNSALSEFTEQQARAEAKAADTAQQEAATNASMALQLQSMLAAHRQYQQQLSAVETDRAQLRTENAELRQTLEQFKAELDASRAHMTRLPANDSIFLESYLKSSEVQRAIQQHPGLTALWRDQLEYLWREDQGGKMKNGMEWHNSVIQLGLTLLNKGGKGLYEEIRSFLPLPCVNTLRDHKHFAADGPGFFRPQALRAAGLIQAAGASKHVGLAFDEMKLSKGLTFALGTDTLTGFSDVDAGAWAQRLEGLMEAQANQADPDPEGADHACRSLASHVLHFEVTSLGPIPTRYSVGYVFTDGIKASELKAVVSECITLIEAAGLEVAYTVCDGAAENRAWMELMADKDLALKVAKDVNITLPCPDKRATECLCCFPSPADPARPVIMLTDGPHLIKKGRNNWEKSGSGTGANGESTAMMLWPPDKNATTPEERTRWRSLLWSDVENLVKCDLFHNPRIMHNVKWSHIELDSWTRMRCHLASQLFGGLEEFCCWVDKKGWLKDERPEPKKAVIDGAKDMHDYVRLFYSTKLAMERKQPITNATDPHLLQLLKNGTFVYNWHEELAAGEAAAAAAAKLGEDSGSDFTPGMRHGLSSQCQSDFQVTAFGMVAVARLFLLKGGASVIMATLNQNAVENAFSQLRGHGQDRAPTAASVVNGETSLRLSKTLKVTNAGVDAPHKPGSSYAPAHSNSSSRSSFAPDTSAAVDILMQRRSGLHRSKKQPANSTWTVNDLAEPTVQPATAPLSPDAQRAQALSQLVLPALLGAEAPATGPLAGAPALATALQEAAAGKPCPAFVQYSSWLLNATSDAVKGTNGKLAALRPVVAAQYSPACAGAWAWCNRNLSVPEPEGWPLRLKSGAQQPVVPASPNADARTTANATFTALGPAACLVHSACYNTSYSLALLDTLMLPDSQHGGTKAQKEERARHSQVYQLYSSASASERLLGWALHSAANSIPASDPRHHIVQQLITGREDGRHRRVFDSDLLESLPQRQLAVPAAGLVGFFVRLHPTIIERFRSANMVLQDGSGAVRKLIDRIRYDRAAWADFKGAVGPGAGGDGGNGGEGSSSYMSHLRSVMGVLVRKYIHASLAGLLRHTQLLAGKDEASKRSLREERRADAARKANSDTKAAGVVDAATRCVDCRRPHPADNMLMCDGCPGAYHAHCLGIPVPEPGSGDWFCPMCRPEAFGRAAMGSNTGAYTDAVTGALAGGRGQRGGRGGRRGRGRGPTADTVVANGELATTSARGRGRGRGGAACGRGRGDVHMEDAQAPVARSARVAGRPKRFHNSPVKEVPKRTRS